jgi:hypothetical protein
MKKAVFRYELLESSTKSVNPTIANFRYLSVPTRTLSGLYVPDTVQITYLAEIFLKYLLGWLGIAAVVNQSEEVLFCHHQF